MKRIQLLIFLIFLPNFVASQKLSDKLYKELHVTKIEYLAHKYQPTHVPCKYGAVEGFDQPHFVPDPIAPFKEDFTCCETCETLHVTLESKTTAKVCCRPESHTKHPILSTKVTKKSKKLEPTIRDPLDAVFDRITPTDEKLYKYRKRNNHYNPKVGTGAYGYIFIGAGIAQTIIALLTVFFWYITKDRIALECVPDCDYEIEQEVKVFNPSKSAMMSENMNSDLMSMSQAAI